MATGRVRQRGWQVERARRGKSVWGRPRRSRMKKETREAVRWVVGWMEKAERRE